EPSLFLIRKRKFKSAAGGRPYSTVPVKVKLHLLVPAAVILAASGELVQLVFSGLSPAFPQSQIKASVAPAIPVPVTSNVRVTWSSAEKLEGTKTGFCALAIIPNTVKKLKNNIFFIKLAFIVLQIHRCR